MTSSEGSSDIISALDALIAEKGEDNAEMTMPAVALRQVFQDAEHAGDLAEELKILKADLSKAKSTLAELRADISRANSALAEERAKVKGGEDEALLKEATQQLEAATAAVEEKNDRIAKLQAELDKLKADKPKRGRPPKAADSVEGGQGHEQESETQRRAREAMNAYRARFESKVRIHNPPTAEAS